MTEHEAFGYQWVRKSTGEFYRGIHRGDPEDNYAGSGVVFTSKYGGRRKSDCSDQSDWVRNVLFMGTYEECLLWESLVVTERVLEDPACLNLVVGGNRGSIGRIVTEETRAKMSKSQTGRKHTEASRKKMSESCRKREPVSEETKRKISAALTGKKLSSETKQKLSEIGKARVFSDAHKESISKAKKGTVVSEETKRKISETKRKQWAKLKETTMKGEVDVK